MIRLISLGVALTCAVSAAAQTVIKDDNVSIARDEMQQIVQRWNPSMQAAAANNAAHRRELAALALASKKVALAAEQVSPEQDPELYWELKLQVQALLRKMMVKHYLDTLEMPDFEPVALERYTADKDKYALVPERRLVSHIVFLCTPPDCDIEARTKTANETLAALRSGEDFAVLEQQYSGDPGTKRRNGEFRWLTRGESRVPTVYTEAVFAIGKVGDYSDVVTTQYGLNIIRLDKVEASHYRPYAEVKADIIASLETEYRKLAAEEFDQQYGPVGELVLTDAALDEIFAPYKTFDGNAATKTGAQAMESPKASVAADATTKAAPESTSNAKGE